MGRVELVVSLIAALLLAGRLRAGQAATPASGNGNAVKPDFAADWLLRFQIQSLLSK